MKCSIKRIACIFLIVALFLCLAIQTAEGSSIPDATSNFYVNDFAGIFTDEQVHTMMTKAVALCEEFDGVQVVVTTINSLNGQTIEQYANAMYNKYKIGKNSMGMLLIVSINDRKVRIEIGRTMEGYFSDGQVATKFIKNYAYNSLHANKFAEGMMNLQDGVISEIWAVLTEERATTKAVPTNASVEADTAVTATTSAVDSNQNKSNNSIFLWFLALCGIEISYLIVQLVKKNQKLKESTAQLEQFASNIASANSTIEKQKNKIVTLEAQLSSLQNRFKYAEIAVPDLEKKIDTAIREEKARKRKAREEAERARVEANKAAAKKFDDTVKKMGNISHMTWAELKKVTQLYQTTLSEEQQFYVATDMRTIYALIREKERPRQNVARRQNIYHPTSSYSSSPRRSSSGSSSRRASSSSFNYYHIDTTPSVYEDTSSHIDTSPDPVDFGGFDGFDGVSDGGGASSDF